jgi:uncharacterized membrane protein YfcA
MDLPSFGLVVLATVAVAAGAHVQGSIGFGLSLVSVPVISLIHPTALPATILLLALPMTMWMALRERVSIHVTGFLQITLGRVFGTAGGVWILAVVPVAQLSVVIGAAVVLAVTLSVFNPGFEAGNRSRVVAGILSGLMGTAAAVGGPPLALAYQKRPGSELRSTLAISFVIGAIMSLVALGIAGKVELGHALFALELMPGLTLGLFTATRLRGSLERGWLRPLVLAFAAISGIVAVAKGLL